MPEAASLWCDLGINYYRQCLKLLSLNQEQDLQMLLEKSVQVLKGLAGSPSSHLASWQSSSAFWLSRGLTCGNVCCSRTIQCIKKAVMLDSDNYSFWNALGVVSMVTGMLAPNQGVVVLMVPNQGVGVLMVAIWLIRSDISD